MIEEWKKRNLKLQKKLGLDRSKGNFLTLVWCMKLIVLALVYGIGTGLLYII